MVSVCPHICKFNAPPGEREAPPARSGNSAMDACSSRLNLYACARSHSAPYLSRSRHSVKVRASSQADRQYLLFRKDRKLLDDLLAIRAFVLSADCARPFFSPWHLHDDGGPDARRHPSRPTLCSDSLAILFLLRRLGTPSKASQALGICPRSRSRSTRATSPSRATQGSNPKA